MYSIAILIASHNVRYHEAQVAQINGPGWYTELKAARKKRGMEMHKLKFTHLTTAYHQGPTQNDEPSHQCRCSRRSVSSHPSRGVVENTRHKHVSLWPPHSVLRKVCALLFKKASSASRTASRDLNAYQCQRLEGQSR